MAAACCALFCPVLPCAYLPRYSIGKDEADDGFIDNEGEYDGPRGVQMQNPYGMMPGGMGMPGNFYGQGMGIGSMPGSQMGASGGMGYGGMPGGRPGEPFRGGQPGAPGGRPGAPPQVTATDVLWLLRTCALMCVALFSVT